MIWFAVNAQLDGLDPGSENVLERTKYLVYQRRMLVDALKNKAMLLAMIDQKEQAATVAQAYLDMVIPPSKMAKQQKEMALEQELAEIEKLGPMKGRAVSTGELVQRERDNQAAAKAMQMAKQGIVPAKPKRIVPLTGQKLADHLNQQVQVKNMEQQRQQNSQKKSVPRRPS